MLKDLPLHTRQSLYRCLDVTSEHWIESEPEITWAKYTCLEIAEGPPMTCSVNGWSHSLFDIPCVVWDDGSILWRCRDRVKRPLGGPIGILWYTVRRKVGVVVTLYEEITVAMRSGVFVIEKDAQAFEVASDITGVVWEVEKQVRMNSHDRDTLVGLLQKLISR